MIIKIYVALLASLLFSGCASNMNINTQNCKKPISQINKIIIDVNIDQALLSDTQVGDGYGKIPPLDSIKNMLIRNITDELENRFKQEIIEKRIEITSKRDCSDHAVVMENNVNYIEHHMGKYAAEIKTKVSNCSNGDVLLLRKEEARNRAFSDTPKELSENLGKYVYRELTSCK
jgi:hypothetical protein